MAEVRFEQATRLFRGSDAPAVDRLDLELADGELLVLVGPSGSGKSTALRMLAGLEEVDAGAVYIGGRDVTDIPPKHRDIAMVFQNYALYPYLDVRANIGFPLKMAGVRKAERERRVSEAAEMLGLTPLLDRKPAQLSGGERQRTAMGRAIVRNPQVFLMDEPLSNLDAKLRVKMRVDIAALQRRLGVTTLYVTHDQVEAMTMGHRVAVLRDGRLQQCGAPARAVQPAGQPVRRRLHRLAGDEPASQRDVNGDGVAELCGVKRRALPRDVVRGRRCPRTARRGRRAAPGVARARRIGGIHAEVEVVEELGADAYAFCVTRQGGTDTKLIARTDWRRPPERGAQRGADAPRPARRTCSIPRPASGSATKAAHGHRDVRDAPDAPHAQRAHRARGDPRRRADLARRDLTPGRDLEADRVARTAVAARRQARARGRRRRLTAVATARRCTSPCPRPGWCSGSTWAPAFCAARSAICTATCARARTSRPRGPTRSRCSMRPPSCEQRLIAASELSADSIDGAVIGVPGVVDRRAGSLGWRTTSPAWRGSRSGTSSRRASGSACRSRTTSTWPRSASAGGASAAGSRTSPSCPWEPDLGAGLVIRGELVARPPRRRGRARLRAGGEEQSDDDPCAAALSAFAATLAAAAPARLGVATLLEPPYAVPAIFGGARAGDPLAEAVVDRGGTADRRPHHSDRGRLDVELVVLGGGIGANGDLLLAPIRKRLAAQLPFPPKVEVSMLGDAAVLTGALAVGLTSALENAFADRARLGARR